MANANTDASLRYQCSDRRKVFVGYVEKGEAVSDEEKYLRDLIQYEQEQYAKRVAPYLEKLAQIETRKNPKLVVSLEEFKRSFVTIELKEESDGYDR